MSFEDTLDKALNKFLHLTRRLLEREEITPGINERRRRSNSQARE